MPINHPLPARRWLHTVLAWSAGFIGVGLLHVLVVAAILYWQPAKTEEATPVVVMELDLDAIAEAPETEEQVAEPDPEPEPEVEPEPEPEPEPEVEPAPAPEVESAPEPKPEPKPEAVPPPKPSKPKPAKPRSQKKQTASKSVGSSKKLKAAQMSWHQKIVARLYRYKRYPRQARRHRKEGVSHVEFTLDRQGKVLDAHIQTSSGSKTLDKATLDLLQRASPLPKPPKGVPGETFTLVVPVDYSLR